MVAGLARLDKIDSSGGDYAPQGLKPSRKTKPYRSAEALRHPKARFPQAPLSAECEYRFRKLRFPQRPFFSQLNVPVFLPCLPVRADRLEHVIRSGVKPLLLPFP